MLEQTGIGKYERYEDGHGFPRYMSTRWRGWNEGGMVNLSSRTGVPLTGIGAHFEYEMRELESHSLGRLKCGANRGQGGPGHRCCRQKVLVLLPWVWTEREHEH